MQILGIGVDIVELRRLHEARYMERVAEFFLLPTELEAMRNSRDSVQFAASRFAAKEAVIKACPERLWYHDLAREKEGEKLSVRFCKPTQQTYKVFLSIAHETAYTVSATVFSI
jgi:phosphopantetheine--protein transferase-like protein